MNTSLRAQPRHHLSGVSILSLWLLIALCSSYMLINISEPLCFRPFDTAISKSKAPQLSPRGLDAIKNDADLNWLTSDSSELKKQALDQGSRLECLMRSPNLSPELSTSWYDPSDLRKYGYKSTTVPHPSNDFISDYGLLKAFQSLGISTKAESWLQMSTGHTSRTKVGDVTYPATGATFLSEINLKQGVVVATQSYGAKFCVERYGVEIGPGDAIVPLERTGDVFWLSWKGVIGGSKENPSRVKVQDLEHMFRWNTVVPEVQEHLMMVAGKDIDIIGEWPGVSYPVEELQGKAALSSANVRGVAWLLSQHKDELGVKTVDRVNIFNCPAPDGDAQWCVYLHIVGVSNG